MVIVEATVLTRFDQKTFLNRLKREYFPRNYENLGYEVKPDKRYIMWIGVFEKEEDENVRVMGFYQEFKKDD